MFKKFLGLTSVIATIFAVVAASSASYLFMYQPKEPKCLKK